MVLIIQFIPNLTTLNWLQAHPGAENISEQVNQALSAKTPHLQAGLNLNAFSPKVTGLTLDPAVALPAMEAAIGQAKVSDVNALLQTVGANGLLQTLKGFVAAPSNTVQSLSDPVALTEELGPLDAMRMRMVPAWESMTRQLSQLNGTNQAAAWGQLSANLFNSKAKGGECKEVVLDLATDDPDLMAALETMVENQSTTYFVNSDSARNTANTWVLGAAATSAALANPGLTDRAAQIQDMADKLGKAMAERLQDQMEKGEWKLQLKLNPAHLGKIDIELDMRSGSLDAVFRTDNLVTRELISQSMPKLKDSLSESGMTVANVWVNSENQKGSGGNSTPRQNSESDNKVNATVSEVKAAESRIKELRSSDAWDTLA
jgi:flagellar hook-length control protein FliK